MSRIGRADKKWATQIKFPDACAAGGRGDPCTQCKERESRNSADALIASQVRVRREESRHSLIPVIAHSIVGSASRSRRLPPASAECESADDRVSAKPE